jgi:hypothetical protein
VVRQTFAFSNRFSGLEWSIDLVVEDTVETVSSFRVPFHTALALHKKVRSRVDAEHSH